MATAESVKAKLQGLLTKANEATGKTDSDLTSGINSLVEGFGAGGGGDFDSFIEGTLTEITSNAEIVKTNCFYIHNTLKSVNMPNLKEVGASGFANCSQLETVNMPNLTTIGASAFQSCGKLSILNFPYLSKMASSAFSSCKKVTKAILPSVEKIESNAFSSCSSLNTVDLTQVSYISSYAFNGCGLLKRVIIRNPTKCTISEINVFNGCYHMLGKVNATYNPDGLKDGYIYVPRSLLETYVADSKWSTFASQFRALEDYTVDGTITGELRDLETYTITVNKSACSIDNSATTIEEGSTYSAIVTGVESQGFMFRRDADFSVKMGGTDITADVVTHDSYPCLTLNINIPIVTGDIVINAYAN